MQATLADSFLADLDELSDNEEDVDREMADIETLNYDDLDSVSKLQKTQRYVDIMQVGYYISYVCFYFHHGIMINWNFYVCVMHRALLS